MRVCKDVLDAIGNTPLVRINKLAADCTASVYAKLEFMNPGGSIKDRLAKHLFEQYARAGLLDAGTTIVENSSGNTGASLSMAAAVKGVRCTITLPDKMSQEKINRMKAFGTEVVVTPTNVPAEAEESYYSVAKRIAASTPGAIYPDQYNNPENALAHYHSTGPEIWEQTAGQVDVVVCGMGTGGTISGVGRYLKEQNKQIKIIGVDPQGSIFYDYFHHRKLTAPQTYSVEGIGEDYLVSALDFDVLDDVVRVNDKQSFDTARQLVRQEGIFCGGSSGSAMFVALNIARDYPGKNIVVILPDSGNMYLSKFMSDEWMLQNNFL